MSPKFNLFVSDVNEQNEEGGWIRDSLAWPERWKNTS